MGSDRQHRTANNHELVTVVINGRSMDIEFSELYTALKLHTVAEQNDFRNNFVGANGSGPPGVTQGKLRRWRPDLAALLEKIPVR